MPWHPVLEVHEEVAQALLDGRAVVALESTLIAHGMPWPQNLQTAQALEAIVREQGAVPATIAVLHGRLHVGLDERQLQQLAQDRGVAKLSRRDLARCMVSGGHGATTVAATMWVAHLAGIRVFATGGIGGVHRGGAQSWDVSADLLELARTPVAVVCAGAKRILDLERTLEVLETHGVPVLAREQDELAAFWCRRSGLRADARLDDCAALAAVARQHWALGGAGMVVSNPIPAAYALSEAEVDGWLLQAEAEAQQQGLRGQALTPYVLRRMAELSGGRSLASNIALVKHNAAVAASLALALAAPPSP
ncbi:pseudouridine-5'-phosphate glycosidase [Roseateles sp. BYS180W]|uniref:Pseudouridine-5'-phosphate glycosidase n=1 Tax=Roseateles rivi TaxID=3299028 RepID=A0ABW7FWN5_9BURK